MDGLLPHHCHHHSLPSASDYPFAPLRPLGVLFGKIQVRKEPFDVLMGSNVRRKKERKKKRFAAGAG